MQLLIKQRVLSWTDTYDIYDETGATRYFVKASFLALGHRLHVYDQNGNELGVVKERLMTLLPAFTVEIGGRDVGTVEKRFTLFRPKYDVNYMNWRAEGDFLGWEYSVYEACCEVVHVTKRLLSWRLPVQRTVAPDQRRQLKNQIKENRLPRPGNTPEAAVAVLRNVRVWRVHCPGQTEATLICAGWLAWVEPRKAILRSSHMPGRRQKLLQTYASSVENPVSNRRNGGKTAEDCRKTLTALWITGIINSILGSLYF